MKLPPFDYHRPTTLAAALDLLAKNGDAARPLAGGQSLMPMMAFRLASPNVLVDLNGIPDLDRITIDGNGVHIGALVRWRDLEREKRLESALPMLAEAVPHIAHYQIRNRGTVGGSLANADPASELPGVAVTCDAVIEVASSKGKRTLPAAQLFAGPLTTTLAADEIITGVQFPAWPMTRKWAFQEFATHRGAFALAGVGLWYDGDAKAARNVHIGVIGVASTPRRLPKAEAQLEGKSVNDASIAATAKAAAAEVDPSDDIHADATYRRALTATLVERALTSTLA
jgi:carbon-monoxide dehydrogenase medium subunit